MIIYKKDGPPDVQNQRDGGPRIVANNHLDDSASSVLLRSFANGTLNDQNQRDRGAGIVANDHLDNPASSFPLQMVICKEDCPPNYQNQRDGGAGLLQMTIWIIRPPSCSSVSLQMVICKEDGHPDGQHCFGRMGLKFAPDLPLVWRILNTKFQHKRTNGSGV